MKLLKIKKDNLDLVFNNEKVNANMIIKDIWNSEKLSVIKIQLTSFYEKYNEMFKSKKTNQFDINVLLSICNFPNPNIKFDLDLNSTEKDIEQIYKSYKKEKIVMYKIITPQELLATLLFHYLSNGYKLKFCPICDYFFFSKDLRTIYCSDDCKKTANSKNELARRKKDRRAYLYKTIYTMLDNRGDPNLSLFKDEYQKKLSIMNKKELIKWLEDTHKKYKRRS